MASPASPTLGRCNTNSELLSRLATIFLARNSPLVTSHFVPFGCGYAALGSNCEGSLQHRDTEAQREMRSVWKTDDISCALLTLSPRRCASVKMGSFWLRSRGAILCFQQVSGFVPFKWKSAEPDREPLFSFFPASWPGRIGNIETSYRYQLPKKWAKTPCNRMILKPVNHRGFVFPQFLVKRMIASGLGLLASHGFT